jgi:Methylamine utilisation protein MauE
MMATDPAIRGLCALALAVIFGASGAMKLRDLEIFEGSLANYQLAPAWLEKPLAFLLPITECASAAGLLITSTRAPAASMLFALLAIFTGAIAINLARGRTNIDCGCFGPALRQELSGWLLLRNFFLMVLAAIVILPPTARAIESLDFVTIVLGAMTLVILYASANFAIGNAPKMRALEMM